MSVQEAPVVIEMWTDLGCPWCYVGKHRLQAAIDQRPDAERFEVRLRSFELIAEAAGIRAEIATAGDLEGERRP